MARDIVHMLATVKLNYPESTPVQFTSDVNSYTKARKKSNSVFMCLFTRFSDAQSEAARTEKNLTSAENYLLFVHFYITFLINRHMCCCYHAENESTFLMSKVQT